jgi:hypothetical protein
MKNIKNAQISDPHGSIIFFLNLNGNFESDYENILVLPGENLVADFDNQVLFVPGKAPEAWFARVDTSLRIA